MLLYLEKSHELKKIFLRTSFEMDFEIRMVKNLLSYLKYGELSNWLWKYSNYVVLLDILIKSTANWTVPRFPFVLCGVLL